MREFAFNFNYVLEIQNTVACIAKYVDFRLGTKMYVWICQKMNGN